MISSVVRFFGRVRDRLSRPYRHMCERDYHRELDRWHRDHGDETLRLAYPLGPSSVVFDVGGYKGDFAAAANEKFGCQVYLFEPVKRFHIECTNRFAGNERVHCLPYGLSDHNGVFDITHEAERSRLALPGSIGEREQVSISSIDRVLDELEIPFVDLLKLNVEGEEYPILRQLLTTDRMSRTGYLQVQFHTFVPYARWRRRAIRSRLSQTHEQMWNYPFIWESWRLKVQPRTIAKDSARTSI